MTIILTEKNKSNKIHIQMKRFIINIIHVMYDVNTNCDIENQNLEQCVCVFRWLSRLWNAVVVPRVEEAIISRVTARRTTTTTTSSPSSSSPSSQRLSPSNCGLSAGQQAVVKAALSILVNKAVLQGCPLPRHGLCSFTFHQLLENRQKTIRY